MIEAVLFDIGDTLLHFRVSRAAPLLERLSRPAYDRLCDLGYPVPTYPAYLRRIRRAFLWAYIRARLRRREALIIPAFARAHQRMGLDISPEQLDELAHFCMDALKPLVETDEHAATVLETLDRRGFRMGLVSNTPFPRFAIDEFLQRDDFLKYFPVRVYSSDVRYMKPHPKIFRLALAQLGTAPERTLFVGDRIDKDVKGAARVGMPTALVAHNGRVPAGRIRPDHVLRELPDLTAILSHRPA